jgi:hypothetical protein
MRGSRRIFDVLRAEAGRAAGKVSNGERLSGVGWMV